MSSNFVAASFQVQPAQRSRVTDRVFEDLLGAILLGDLKPGQPVPTQRQLSKQFGVSPLVVRQAIHRLEELSLVRVRQGSPTIVLDPQQASDVRLIQLQLEVAMPGDALMLAGIENRALATLPLLVLAERRITSEELDTLDALVESLSAEPSPAELAEFQCRYWELMAIATRNPLLRHQVRWWFRATGQSRGAASLRVVRLPADHYRDINRALRRRKGTSELMLRRVLGLLAYTEAQPGHAWNVERAAKRANRQAAQLGRRRR